MSGLGGARGTFGNMQAKRISNDAANETARLQTAEINGVVQDLISRVEEKSKLNFLRELALKEQRLERKRKRKQYEDEKRRQFLDSVTRGAPS